MYIYEYPRPALTADIVLFNEELSHVLLIQRRNDPYKDCWAFPGGFFDMTDSDIEHTAARETNTMPGHFRLACQTVSVVFTACVNRDNIQPRGGDDAKEARWFPLDALPPLAFDHAEILKKILKERVFSSSHNK